MFLKKACIFDLDGTIFDSLDIWNRIDVDFLARRGLEVPEDYCRSISMMRLKDTAIYTIERFSLDETPEAVISEWTEMAQREYSENVFTKPFAREYLASLRRLGIKTAVATTNNEELYLPALRNNGILDMFDVIVDGSMVSVGKSEPDIYLLAAELLGERPENCMVFEDVLNGIKSAKSVGFSVTAVIDKASRENYSEITSVCDDFIMDFERPLNELKAPATK